MTFPRTISDALLKTDMTATAFLFHLTYNFILQALYLAVWGIDSHVCVHRVSRRGNKVCRTYFWGRVTNLSSACAEWDTFLKGPKDAAEDLLVTTAKCHQHTFNPGNPGGSWNALMTTSFPLALFRDLLSWLPWDNALEGRGAHESWLIFKGHILQIQEWYIPTKRKSGRNTRRPAWMKNELLTELKQKKKAYNGRPRMEAMTDNLGGVQKKCPNSQGSG